MIKDITHNKEIFAKIIRPNFDKDGIQFFTPDSFSQQVGIMKRNKGYEIEAHLHLRQSRQIEYTNEVLFIKSGLVRIDFYDNEQEYFGSFNLTSGDLIILVKGGHGFYFIEESIIIEVKQGPYIGEIDKKRFKSKIKNIKGL